MPEWLIIVAVFFVVSRLVRSSRRRGHGRGRIGRAHARDLSEGGGVRPLAPPRVETPMEALQRRYVEGSITVEQYERELDELFRKP
jgi:hypothetical protein